MTIRLYNTLSRSKETFKPLKKGVVSMYHCGPTVYDTPHIGNYRTFIMADLVRRVFEYAGYDVHQAMNITDVDDKTIRRSREQGITLFELTRKYESMFLEGLEALHILRPKHLVRATEHIPAMIALIEKLLQNGTAYPTPDGVYVRIDSVKNYGQLAGLKSAKKSDTEIRSVSRVANDEYEKDDPRDFAVWKFKSPLDGHVSWQAPFGEGRPGWHIECSAMSMEALGQTIDIHTGGSDLIFPHHTNEIAQSESATSAKFADYWLHGGFMAIREDKMAKSKGNTIKLEDLAAMSISLLAFRYWTLTAHYRSPVNFTDEAVRAAQSALLKLMRNISEYPEGGSIDAAYKERFESFISDDLDMPQAVALAWELIKDAEVFDADKRATLIDFDRVFGLDLANVPKLSDQPAESIPPEIHLLAEARNDARKNKDWKMADALRVEIEARGFTVKDTDEGYTVSAI